MAEKETEYFGAKYFKDEQALGKAYSGRPRGALRPAGARPGAGIQNMIFNALMGASQGAQAARGTTNPALAGIQGAAAGLTGPRFEQIQAAREAAQAQANLQAFEAADFGEVAPEAAKKYGLDGVPLGIAQRLLPTLERSEYMENRLLLMEAQLAQREKAQAGTREYRAAALDLKRQAAEDKASLRDEKSAAMRRAASAQAGRIMEKVSQAVALVGKNSAGVGAKLSGVPGSKAKDLATVLQTIKANLGFAELQAMRQASPTGGALGAIAVQELEALQSTVASLDQEQSPDQLRKNLDEVRKHYDRWQQIVAADDERINGIGQEREAPIAPRPGRALLDAVRAEKARRAGGK